MTGKFEVRLVLSYGLLLLWLISGAVLVGINSGWLYRICVVALHLPQHYHVALPLLQHNFHQMIQYLQFPWQSTLQLAGYRLSPTARTHFQDVKRLVLIVEMVFLATSGWVLWATLYQRLFRQIWRLESLITKTLIIIGILVVLLIIDFQDWFIYFHRLVFRNQDWIFNPRVDPIINVLPEQYFAAACGLMLGTLVLALLGLLLIGHYQLKKARP
ncbi:TIGR01906 family membrane protein [Fructilactobacillus myrtifloralis]|uniref:TIGR01906 family membrane protein n=1 Tax=Fructilactobacillus myrtifloralis TaxID=2940301 RepID=A0ABY5BNF9_9LACO|nr:TIGR01906 family membrane protein [Fructilactobacillus myrtifloralis]USS85212.1 TIGR01906 family membrane protein [Fructilactobacillus myrtifloralis]